MAWMSSRLSSACRAMNSSNRAAPSCQRLYIKRTKYHQHAKSLVQIKRVKFACFTAKPTNLSTVLQSEEHYPLDKSIGFGRTYQLYSDLSAGLHYSTFEQQFTVAQCRGQKLIRKNIKAVST